MCKRNESFADYVSRITNHSSKHLTPQKQHRQFNLPKVEPDKCDTLNPYMLKSLDRAKFPKMYKYKHPVYLDVSYSESRNFESLASQLVLQLEQSATKQKLETPNIKLHRFQLNIQKSKILRRSPQI